MANLSEYLVEPESDARIEQIWRGIEARQDEYVRPVSKRKVMVVSGALAVAAGVLLALFVGAPSDTNGPNGSDSVALSAHQLNVGAKMRTATEEISVNLADGSLVTLGPESSVALQETKSANIALNLEVGRVECNVVKEKRRVFSVLAGDVTVRVIGTQFSVERFPVKSGERVMVEVREGVVEVRGPDGIGKRLSAGESWSVTVATDRSGPQPEKQSAEAHAAGPQEESTEMTEKSVVRKDETQSPAQARDLFADARAARNAGDAARAAQLYQEFLTQQARDPRAGVAALELGRLRMDQLGDVSGAIAPLSKAATTGSGLGDDALARLARAHALLGQVSSCQSARARYLKSYPQGVHVEQVRALCP